MKPKGSVAPARVTAADVQAVEDYVFLFIAEGIPVDRPPKLQAEWDRLAPVDKLTSILDHARRWDRVHSGSNVEQQILDHLRKVRHAR